MNLHSLLSRLSDLENTLLSLRVRERSSVQVRHRAVPFEERPPSFSRLLHHQAPSAHFVRGDHRGYRLLSRQRSRRIDRLVPHALCYRRTRVEGGELESDGEGEEGRRTEVYRSECSIDVGSGICSMVLWCEGMGDGGILGRESRRRNEGNRDERAELTSNLSSPF